MAVSSRSRNRWLTNLHYLIRIAGLVGCLAIAVGAALVYKEGLDAPSSWLPALEGKTTPAGTTPSIPAIVGAYMALAGAFFAALALVMEVIVRLAFSNLGRSGVGVNAAFQIILVLGVVALCNFYSFRHYLRFDWTRDQRFTLPENVQAQLRQLKGETIVVVSRQHRASVLQNKEDNYDDAAERQVVENIYDLVDQLRELGSQFRVFTLDVRSEDYEDRLEEIQSIAPHLADELDRINENTVVFYVQGDPSSDKGGFKISSAVLDALQDMEVNDPVHELSEAAIDGLEGLEDKNFTTRAEFLEAISNAIGKKETDRWQDTLLKLSKNGDLQKLSFNALYQLDKEESRDQGYEISERVLRKLSDRGVDDESIAKLQSLRGDKFRSREAFIEELTDTIGRNEADRWRKMILRFARLTRRDQHRNLALRHDGYGIEPFTRRIFNIGAKKPKVALLSIHGVLSTRSDEKTIGSSGLAKFLADNGFEVVDIILKRWGQGPSQPTVLTYEESQFDSLDRTIEKSTEQLNARKKSLAERQDDLKKLKDGDDKVLYRVLAERDYLILVQQGVLRERAEIARAIEQTAKKWSDEDKKLWRGRAIDFMESVTDSLAGREQALEMEIRTTRKERDSYNVESVTELKRIKDLKAKLDRVLSECDLVILPRPTVLMLAPTEAISSSLYQLNRAQTAAIKQYLYEGKPLLACFGPPTAGRVNDPGDSQGEDLEDALTELGIQLGKQVVLYPAEGKTLASTLEDSFAPRTPPIPAVRFDWHTKRLEVVATDTLGKVLPPNPIRESMRLSGMSVRERMRRSAKSISPSKLDLQLHAARPIFIDKDKREQFKFDPEIMRTDSESWNEIRLPPWTDDPPIPPSDGAAGSLKEKGHGPFALGVSVEVKVPETWGSSSTSTNHDKARLVVLGHGGLFAGDNLSDERDAPRGKLLLDCCDWLVGRDDLLGRAEPATTDSSEHASKVSVWKYPRVKRWSARELQLWGWGTTFGLPLFFGCLGCVVILSRKMR